MTSAALPLSARIRRWLPPTAIVLLTVTVYWTVLRNEPVWDDTALIVRNPHLRAWEGLLTLFRHDLWTASAQQEPSDFYRPLVMATFFVNRLVGGPSAASYHLGNVLLHAAVGVALYRLLRGMVGEGGGLVAGLVAVGFVVAPITSEPVVWLSGRFDLLATLLALVAVQAHRDRGARASVGVVALFACALLCKESVVVIPALLLFDDLLHRRVLSRATGVRMVAIGLVMVGYLLVRRAVGVATAAATTGAPLGEIFRAYWLNVANALRLLVWPVGLDPFHPYAPPSWRATLVWMALCLVPLGALGAAVWRAERRTPAHDALFGVGWFLLAFGPVAGTGPNLQMMGDRYAYLPLVGLSLTAAVGLDRVRARWAPHRRWWALVGGLCLVFVLGARVTVARIADWRDEPTLFRASLRSHPDNPYALYSLGALAAQRGDLTTAEPLLRASLRGRPDAWRTLNALCMVGLRRGRLAEAEGFCRQSLALNARNPRAWSNLASVHVRAGRWAAALEAADAALRVKPGLAEGHYLRGVSCANLGRMPEAEAALAQALAIEPDHAGARDLQGQIARWRATLRR